MTVRLGAVIEALDAAYPPGLAQSWDSVGLVCGDPDDTLSSVTIAVDATAAVVDAVPDGGLLVAHHPLLLRGVDTVAASTAKGSLIHRMIRSGRSLFAAHTNADSASPGVSDALAAALGLTVEAVVEPAPARQELDKWVIFVPVDNADAVREAIFAAGAGQIGDYSHCCWSVTGTGQFLPHDGANPTIGSVGAVERVAEDRVEAVAPTRARRRVLAAMRAAHPYEEPAFDVIALAPLPSDVGLGRIGSLKRPESLSAFVSRSAPDCPRRLGERVPRAIRTRRCHASRRRRRRRLAAVGRRRRRRAGRRHRGPATRPSRRASPRPRCRTHRCRPWASEFRRRRPGRGGVPRSASGPRPPSTCAGAAPNPGTIIRRRGAR